MQSQGKGHYLYINTQRKRPEVPKKEKGENIPSV